MAVESKIAIARILADLNLVVRYGIAIRIICKHEILADFNLAVVISTTKSPNLIPRQIFLLYSINQTLQYAEQKMHDLSH